MGFLDRFRKNRAGKPVALAAKQAAHVSELQTEKKDSELTLTPSLTQGRHTDLAVRFLSRPHVSEKAARASGARVYVFDVELNAEKIAIKKAVEAQYKVKVTGVRTIRHAGKSVSRGRKTGRRNAWKKALVTLAEGQSLQIYEGV